MKTRMFKFVLLALMAFLGAQSALYATTSSEAITKKKKTEAKVDSIPQFTVKKLTMLNEQGDTMRYEDGSIQYHYIIYNRDSIYHPETAKKLTNASLKSGLMILLKVGAGAAAGGGIGKLVGGKKGAWIGSAIGALGGLAFSARDIKKIKENNSTLKLYKSELQKYSETFTEEGLPINASADLSAYNDCEESTAYAQEVYKQLADNKEYGKTSIEDVSDEELEKL